MCFNERHSGRTYHLTKGVHCEAHKKEKCPNWTLLFFGCGLSAEPELFTSANVRVRASRVPLKLSTILSS